MNWPAYNEGFKRRGSLTIWFDQDMTWEATPTGKRGRHPLYSDAAVQTCLYEGAVRHGAAPDNRLRREPAATHWPRLDCARLQHPEPTAKDPEGQHPLSRIAGSVAPAA